MSEEERKLLEENNALLKDIHRMLSNITSADYRQNDMLAALAINLVANMAIKR